MWWLVAALVLALYAWAIRNEARKRRGAYRAELASLNLAFDQENEAWDELALTMDQVNSRLDQAIERLSTHHRYVGETLTGMGAIGQLRLPIEHQVSYTELIDGIVGMWDLKSGDELLDLLAQNRVSSQARDDISALVIDSIVTFDEGVTISGQDYEDWLAGLDLATRGDWRPYVTPIRKPVRRRKPANQRRSISPRDIAV